MIRELNASGVTFLVVEHNIPLVLDLCDPVYVFARGRCIAQGPPGQIRHDPVVLDAYLGDDWRPETPRVTVTRNGGQRSPPTEVIDGTGAETSCGRRHACADAPSLGRRPEGAAVHRAQGDSGLLR